MKKYIYIFSLFIISLSACKKDEVIGGTAVQDMSGEWWVQLEVVDQEGKVVQPYSDDTYYSLSTYNTADNSNTQMWFDDNESYWQVKGKVNVNVTDKTFSGDNVANQYYDSKFSVTNGKIVKDGAVGPVSKAVTDAISFTVTYDDDSDNLVYHFKGYHRTKFPGDDH